MCCAGCRCIALSIRSCRVSSSSARSLRCTRKSSKRDVGLNFVDSSQVSFARTPGPSHLFGDRLGVKAKVESLVHPNAQVLDLLLFLVLISVIECFGMYLVGFLVAFVHHDLQLVVLGDFGFMEDHILRLVVVEQQFMVPAGCSITR